eukprot:c17652_g1_i2 orf=276-2303(+)
MEVGTHHLHCTYPSPLFVQCAFCCACSCLLFFLIRPVYAQESVEELRNSYNFLEAGLSTLAAGAGVALCLARGRLDSEMHVVDFFTLTKFHVQNKYGSKVSFMGNNGSVIGVSLGSRDWNHNAVMWIAHNTWAQGSSSTLVRFCSGVPTAPTHTPTMPRTLTSASTQTPSTSPIPMTISPPPVPASILNAPTPTSPAFISASTPTSPGVIPTSISTTLALASSRTPTSTFSLLAHTSTSSLAPTSTPIHSTPTFTTAPPTCMCWHIPSIAANSAGRGGLASLHDVNPMNPPDAQCYRIPSYQCHIHGQDRMPALHDQVQRDLASGLPLDEALQGPSQLVQYMLADEQDGVPRAYFFGVDNLGAQSLKRMVSESMATQDASEKGRTSDLVDWSLGRLALSDKPNVRWHASASTVVLVSLLELVLMLVLCVVFGLDPFVSSLGARRGIRSLRLGGGGVTVFADLWLLEVKGYTIRGWEDTPVLRVTPRRSLGLWYFDAAMKMVGLLMVFSFWIACVFGYAHPLGLKRSEAWSNKESWAIYLGTVGTVIGLFTSFPLTGVLGRVLPTMSRGSGYHMLRLCWVECVAELVLAVLRILHSKNQLGTMRVTSHDHYWALLPCWYVTLEMGVWLQWLTSKRTMQAGPHSADRVAWAFTAIQAGAFARATVLAAVSGSWQSEG